MQFVQPIPFTEAVDKLGRKELVGSKLDASEWADVPVALRERAFFSSTVESVRFLQRARDSIGDFLQENRETLPNGKVALKTGGRAAFVDQMKEFLASEGVERTSGGLKDITSQRRLELIFDVQTRQAQDYGYWKQGQDPDVLDAFPAQRFIRVIEVKEPRDWHVQFEGEVRLKSDLDFWRTVNKDFGVPWGPWGWGCGHDVEDVSREEAEALGLLQPGQAVQPVDKQLNDDLEASLQGLDAELVKFLQEAFGSRIRVAGDAVEWVGEPASAPAPRPSGSTEATPRQKPVSQAADLAGLKAQKLPVQRALSAIDAAHDDGKLEQIPFTNRVRKDSQGIYRHSGEIGIKRSGAVHPELTTVHEVGHWLDHKALPGS